MCTVVAWAGTLPKSMLTHLLDHAESRGKDSTGIAYREGGDHTNICRECMPASRFVMDHQETLGKARRSSVGIAHARRASPGNPVNNANAHPFAYFQYIFAHNGRITNVKELCDSHIAALNAKDHLDVKEKRQLDYYKNCTTDSMIIGPYIHHRNFTDLIGDMGLVWMAGNKVYCMRSCKELSCATLVWKTREDAGVVTVAASTAEIINGAIKDCLDLTVTSQFYVVEQNHVYNLTPDLLLDEGEVPVNELNKHDDYSSGMVLPQEDEDNTTPESATPANGLELAPVLDHPNLPAIDIK